MGECSKKTIRLKDRTSSSFGFEWSKFNEIYSEYEQNFLSYVYPLTPSSFKDKVVLDAGCGSGRHVYFAAEWGAKLSAGFDISPDAIKAAEYNIRDLPNAKVTVHDIYNITNEKTVDIVMAIGVLHHLPEPEQGFVKLLQLVKPGGYISIWVYGKRDNRLALYLYEPIRKITTRIPYIILYWLSLLPAVFVQILNWLHFPLFRHYTHFPFKTKWNDVFDVLSAPSAKYYTEEEIRNWYESAGLKDIQISYRMMNGKAKGIRALGVKP